jgi:TetR/AcrR family transcriptional repressor of nem operon
MPRPREFDPEQAMQEAMEAFWEHGYNATSVKDLLAEMGLNRGSLYGAFGDKKKLFLAALEKYDQHQFPIFQGILNRPGPARDNLRDLFDLVVDRCCGPEGRRGCLAAKAAMELVPQEQDVADWLRKFNQRNERAIADVIRRGQDEGDVNRALNPRTTARYLLSSMGGLRMHSIMSPTRKEIREVVDLILKVLD